MEEQIKDILRRRGALYIINDHRFYTEDSMKAALIEALTVAKNNIDQADVSGSLPSDGDIIQAAKDYGKECYVEKRKIAEAGFLAGFKWLRVWKERQ